MGYFANGFVFTAQPDFAAAAAVVPGRFVRGYRHKQLSVWLMDYWKPRGKLLLRNAPFADPAIDRFRMEAPTLDRSTAAFLANLQRLKDLLECGTPDPEFGYVHLALSVGSAAKCPAFLFAADDEEIDFGCRTAAGSLVSVGCRLDWLSVRYADGQVTVTPMNLLSEGNEGEFKEMLAKVGGLHGINVLPPREIENGLTLYENPVGQWPKDGGDPAAVLGLGTWDPLVNVENDFDVVFERLIV